MAAQASAARSGASIAKLALAVVTKRGGLQHRRATQIRDRAMQAFERPHLAIRRGRQAGVVRNDFSRMRCCVVCRTDPLGRTGAQLSRGLGGWRRNIFELERYYADVAREIGNRVQIVVGSLNFQIGHLPGRRILIRRQRVDAIAHAPRRDGEHAPQLAASQHADGRAGQYRLDHASSSERTLAACSSRNTRSFSRSAGS